MILQFSEIVPRWEQEPQRVDWSPIRTLVEYNAVFSSAHCTQPGRNWQANFRQASLIILSFSSPTATCMATFSFSRRIHGRSVLGDSTTTTALSPNPSLRHILPPSLKYWAKEIGWGNSRLFLCSHPCWSCKNFSATRQLILFGKVSKAKSGRFNFKLILRDRALFLSSQVIL